MVKQLESFSIFELLVILALIGILTSITVYPVKNFLEQNRTLFYADTIKDAISFTRMSAIMLGQKVIFCHDNKSYICKMMSDQPFVTTEKGKILRYFPKADVRDKIYFRASGKGKRYNLTFMSNGILDGHNGSFFYCPNNRRENAMAIIFNKSGRIRLDSKDPQGNRINCHL